MSDRYGRDPGVWSRSRPLGFGGFGPDPGSLGSELERAIGTLAPERVIVTRPGEHRVLNALQRACDEHEVPLDVRPDESFTCSLEALDAWAEGRRELTMEYFYRERRRALGVLLTQDGKPRGRRWNYDAESRESFDH